MVLFFFLLVGGDYSNVGQALTASFERYYSCVTGEAKFPCSTMLETFRMKTIIFTATINLLMPKFIYNESDIMLLKFEDFSELSYVWV